MTITDERILGLLKSWEEGNGPYVRFHSADDVLLDGRFDREGLREILEVMDAMAKAESEGGKD